MIKTLSDLEVFNLSYKLAMEIFNLTRNFPKEEKYSLTTRLFVHPVLFLQILPKDGEKEFMRTNLKNILFMQWVPRKKRKSGYYLQKTAYIFLLKLLTG